MQNLLTDPSPTVFVSLAENDPELAEAAVDAGADGLKVHLNVSHRASGNEFGDVDDEVEAIQAIGELDVPLGVVPGQDLRTVRETVPKLDELPVDFVDAYAHHHPAEIRSLTDRNVWTAPSEDYDRAELLALDSPDVDALELALQPKSRYGDPTSMRDIARYVDFADEINVPVVIPSQLALTPTDAVILTDRGVTNFLLGAVVTGDTPTSVSDTVESFVMAFENA